MAAFLGQKSGLVLGPPIRSVRFHERGELGGVDVGNEVAVAHVKSHPRLKEDRPRPASESDVIDDRMIISRPDGHELPVLVEAN